MKYYVHRKLRQNLILPQPFKKLTLSLTFKTHKFNLERSNKLARNIGQNIPWKEIFAEWLIKRIFITNSWPGDVCAAAYALNFSCHNSIPRQQLSL